MFTPGLANEFEMIKSSLKTFLSVDMFSVEKLKGTFTPRGGVQRPGEIGTTQTTSLEPNSANQLRKGEKPVSLGKRFLRPRWKETREVKNRMAFPSIDTVYYHIANSCQLYAYLLYHENALLSRNKKGTLVLRRKGSVVTSNLSPSNGTARPHTFLPVRETHSLSLCPVVLPHQPGLLPGACGRNNRVYGSSLKHES